MRADEERDVTIRDRWTEALGWHVVLRNEARNDFTYASRREWQDWYAEPANRCIFAALSRLLADRHRYSKRDLPGTSELEQDQYDLSVPIAEWRRNRAQKKALPRRRRPSSRRWWWWLSGGLGAAAMALLLTLSPLSFGPERGAAGAAVYQTGIGGIQEVHLRDGSNITLGARTKLSVVFSAKRRSVSLIEGQAWFKVLHHHRWPFVVSAGDGTITDLGTAFLVTRESDRVVVAVTEGTVEVKARPYMWSRILLDTGIPVASATTSIRVSRGEQLTLSSNGVLGRVNPTDTHAVTAWTRGYLTFENQPLRYVVETINRYSPRRIIVSPAAGRLRLSGVVFENDIQEWLGNLGVILPVTVQEQNGSLRIQVRHPTQSSGTPR